MVAPQMDKKGPNKDKRSEKMVGRRKPCNKIAQIDYTQRLPAEILTKIFVIVQEQFETSESDIAKLRQVCRRWCDVVDENIYFYVDLNNQTLHGPSMNHVRVNECSVDDFYIAPPRNQSLFSDPRHIKQLSLDGKVSRKNFFWLISQLGKLDHLSINPRFLQFSNYLEKPTNSNEASIINKFWSNIKDIECVAVQMFKNKNLNVQRNFTRILSANMPSLNSINIVAYWSQDLYSLLISFLLRHPSVAKIHLILNDNKRLFKQYIQPDIQDMGKVQLKNILYVTHCDDGEGHQKIMALIKSQRSLEELHISSFTNVCVDVVELRDFFRINESTLTSLNLGDIILRVALDASIFQRLVCLKELTLGKGDYYQDESSQVTIFPEFANLVLLPCSLNLLDIRNISCEAQELYEIVVSNRLENLKSLHLHNVGNDIVTPKFVDVLVMKKGMEAVMLSPLDLSRFEVMEREKKKFVIAKNGYLLPVIRDDKMLLAELNFLKTI